MYYKNYLDNKKVVPYKVLLVKLKLSNIKEIQVDFITDWEIDIAEEKARFTFNTVFFLDDLFELYFKKLGVVQIFIQYQIYSVDGEEGVCELNMPCSLNMESFYTNKDEGYSFSLVGTIY